MHTSQRAPPPVRILAWLTLAALGVRLRHASVIDALGGPEAALGCSARELMRQLDVRAWRSRPPDDDAKRAAASHARAGVEWSRGGGRVLLPHQLGSLAPLRAAPLVAFSRGPTPLLSRRPAIAIVGSRAATPRGLERARVIAETAARAGVVVVSGGALGVDTAAHEAALAGGGETVVVLGEAARARRDERPPRVRALADRGGTRLLTLSPHGPWVAQDRRLWASRNAVIAALADAVVVIEGRARSGTLYTAKAAKELGRTLLAVPGDPDDEVAAAPNELLRRGDAAPLLRVDDPLVALGRASPRVSTQPAPRPCSPEEARVLAAVGPRGAETDIETLARRASLSPAALHPTLLVLELDGLLQREGPRVRRRR